jgi:hypothetical protein
MEVPSPNIFWGNTHVSLRRERSYKPVQSPKILLCSLGIRGYSSLLTILQRMLFITVYNCHQLWFLNHCRYATTDNSRLSAVILELLLIIGISNGSYSKITYNYNSHISYNLHTSTYTVTNHIQALTQVHIQAHAFIIHSHNKHRYNCI